MVLNGSAKEEPPFRLLQNANGQGVKNIKIALHPAAGGRGRVPAAEGCARGEAAGSGLLGYGAQRFLLQDQWEGDYRVPF